MHDLASYGIGIREIKDTILWVCKLDVERLPDMQPSSLNSVIDSLTSSHGPALNMNASSPDIAIVADPQNMTATATAYVLWGLMEPELFVEGMGSCIVLSEGQVLPQDSWHEQFLSRNVWNHGQFFHATWNNKQAILNVTGACHPTHPDRLYGPRKLYQAFLYQHR